MKPAKPELFFNSCVGPKATSKRSAQAKIVKAYETHKQHEAELSRAMNRWQKSRAVLHRLEKQLDKEFGQPHHGHDDAFPEDRA